jgi:hydroxyquinol 1,2-dioxygenase
MDGQSKSSASRAMDQLFQRLEAAPTGRVAEAARQIFQASFGVIAAMRPSEAEFDALVQFLTDVGYATDARRQEWVLLADVFGLTAAVAGVDEVGEGGTPGVLPGPFFRADAPMMDTGANISRDGVGVRLAVAVRVQDCRGAPVAGAQVVVWHANAAGRYENQDPDNQPEHNLRGQFVTDLAGLVTFSTIRPAGYSLPDDGPVGQLARRLGLSLARPAHVHFSVTAAGYRPLVTAVFDQDDPAIGCDALCAVHPALVAEFPRGRALEVTLALAREGTV